MNSRILLYVGTYTHPSYDSKAVGGKGIYTYEFDPIAGALIYLDTTTDIVNPSFLATNSDGRYLYAISELVDQPEGFISAYAIQKETGQLKLLNRQTTPGRITAYVSVDRTNRYALIANYGGSDSIAMFPIKADRSLQPVTSSIEHTASHQTEGSKRTTHAHCIVTDPSNQYAYVADLGLDQIMIYRLDFENQQLIPNIIPSLTLQPGSGPRHFVFHPNGKFAYVTQELGSLISALAYDSSTGGLELLQTVSMLPEGFSGENFAADLHVSPSGRFLYGSNRGHDSIVIFTVDEQTGQLTLLSHHATNGHWPRNFVIDPTGNFLLVGNQYSGTINSFRLDQDTGLMQDTKYVTQIPAPACLKMIRF